MTGAAAQRQAQNPAPGAATLWVCGLILLVWSWWPDVRDLAALVWTRNTYNHGILVPVVSLWLIWRDRRWLSGVRTAPWSGGLPVLIAAVALWLAGSLFDASLLRQLAFIGALQGITLLCFGPALYRRILFPMLFLFLMVPFGGALIPPLQVLTARWTVWLLHLVGVPVTSDGVLITLPSGVYEVARACSGVQFLFASVVTSVLMAYLAFKGWRRRLLMVLAGILVPLAANILRVFSILIISELTDQAFARGVDHIVYGWVFLSVVLISVIAIAYRFADRTGDEAPPSLQRGWTEATVSAVGAFLFLPLLGSVLLPPVVAEKLCPLPPPPALECARCDYRALDAIHSDGWPRYEGADQEARALYRDAGTRVQLYRMLYSPERPGHRLSGPENRLASDGWKTVPAGGGGTVMAGGLKGQELLLMRGESRRLVWRFQIIDGHAVTGRWETKLWAGLIRLKHGANRAAVLMVATDLVGTHPDDRAGARAVLRKFLSTFPPDTILWGGVMNAGEDSVCVASAE